MEGARTGAGSSRPFLTQVGHLWACGSTQTCIALTTCSQAAMQKPEPGWVGGDLGRMLQENEVELGLVMLLL